MMCYDIKLIIMQFTLCWHGVRLHLTCMRLLWYIVTIANSNIKRWLKHIPHMIWAQLGFLTKRIYILQKCLNFIRLLVDRYMCAWWHSAVSHASISVLKTLIFLTKLGQNKPFFLIWSYFHGPIHYLLYQKTTSYLLLTKLLQFKVVEV